MISVCIATYNGATHLAEQLRSILPQLSAGDEVIISDDGSTDGTLSVIETFRHSASADHGPAIRLTINAGEHGYTPNFENALRQAQGDYIFLSDQDDVWLPNKVEVMLQALRDKHFDLVVSNARITDAELRVTHDDYFQARGVHTGLLGNIFKFGYLGCCIALTRQQLERTLPFPADHRYCTHDNWLFLCAQAMGHVLIIRTPLMLYRRHGDTQTTGALNAHKPVSFRIRYRLYLVWHLLLRVLFRR